MNRTIFLTLFVELGIAIVQERFFLSYRLVSRSWTGMVISHIPRLLFVQLSRVLSNDQRRDRSCCRTKGNLLGVYFAS